MKTNILVCIVLIFGVQLAWGQQWRTELEKHEDLPVKVIIDHMEDYYEAVGKTRENKYHHWLRWMDFALSHQDENGYLFNHARKNRELVRKMDRQAQQVSSAQRHFQGHWEDVTPDNVTVPSGPTPHMGRINCIAKPPSNSNIIYAGAATGGLWKTYNHGASWIPLWDGMVQMGVSDVVIDIANENHILVLTGDADGFNIPSAGVVESYDAGSTWRVLYEIPMENTEYGYSMVQDREDLDRYYIGFRDGNLRSISTATFPATPTYHSIFAKWFDLEYTNTATPTLFAATSAGIVKKEWGQPFTLISNTGANLPTWPTSRSNIAVAESNPNVIYYLSADANSDNYGLFRSLNGGSSFSLRVDSNSTLPLVQQETYDMSLIVDPSNSNVVYIGTVEHYRSTNGGLSWTVDDIDLHADIHNHYFLDGRFYLCTDGGLSYRNIGSTTFINLSTGLNALQFYDLDVSGTRIVGGTQDNGTIFWNEGDLTGERKNCCDGFDCVYDPDNWNIVYTSTQFAKYRSTNNGNTNTPLFASEWQDPIVFDVSNSNRVIMHVDTVLAISNNDGVSWSLTDPIFSDENWVHSITQCQADPSVVYLAKQDSFAKSTNFNSATSSINFTKSDFGFSNMVRSLLVHPNNSNLLFAVLWGYHNTQIYASNNGGTTWTPYSQGIEQLPVYCIVYDHVNTEAFYIGTELGVYYRSLYMDEWIPYSTYLPKVPVHDIKVTNSHVYAGTFGRGIWKSPGYTTCASNLTLTQANDPTSGGPSGFQVHKASNTISASRIIQGGAGSDVLYQAGNYVDLTDGFLAKQFNVFTAKAAGCLD